MTSGLPDDTTPTAGERARLRHRAKALIGAGQLATLQGDYTVGEQRLVECIAICDAIDEPFLRNLALGYRVMTASFAGDWAAAARLQQEQETHARMLGDPLLISMALYGKGRAASEFGDDALARASLEESLRHARVAGDVSGVLALTPAAVAAPPLPSRRERGMGG
jgi:non-specific serine/threonine protein kinase